MRCTQCDYPLWDLKARQCPECGLPFQPSEMDLVPNSVRFCCPYCDQAYYGTGDRGQLVPAAFSCVSCGRQVHMNEMVLRAAEGVSETQTRAESMPWFEREQRGTIKAWFATLVAAMNRPVGLIDAVPESVSLGRAWSFMFLSNLIFFTIGQLIPTLVVFLGLWFVMPSIPGLPGMGRLMTVQTVIQQLVFVIVFAVLPLVWVWMTHATLKITGGVGANMRRTSHALFYSVGAASLTAFPLCDCVGFAGLVWWLVAATLMVQRVHGCNGGRATLAVVASGVVLSIASGAVIGAIAYLSMGGMGGGFTAVGGAPTLSMTQSVIDHAKSRGAAGPDHAARMILTGDASVGSFTTGGTQTLAGDVPIGDTTLDQLILMPEGQQREVVEVAATRLPAGTIAHRLGDFVFTHHGANCTANDGRLWLLILLPDPGANGISTPAQPVEVGLGNGGVQRMSLQELLGQLDEQNRHRASVGLPPLPDPSTIVHGEPAVGGWAAPPAEAPP